MHVVESLRCCSTVGHTNFKEMVGHPLLAVPYLRWFSLDAPRHAKPSTLEKVAPLLRSSKTLSPFGLTQVVSALQAKPLLLEAGVDSAAQASSKPKHFLHNPCRLSVAMVSREIPKAEGHDQCTLGYVNTLGTTCASPIYYEVAPSNGKACEEGWMNIGVGYCKEKKGPLGIF